jgi:hypothetical protein
MSTDWRKRFKRMLWQLFWLTGLAIIIYYAPPSYRALNLADGEQVVAFVGKGHELVTVAGGSRPQYRPPPKLVKRLLPTPGGPNGSYLCRGDSIWVWDLDNGEKHKLALGGPLAIYEVTACGGADRLCICGGPGASTPDLEEEITVVDVKKSRVIRRVSGVDRDGTTISEDGKTLAYGLLRDPIGNCVACLDVGTGDLLHKGAAGDGFVSPDGKYLAMYTGEQAVVELGHHRLNRLVDPSRPSLVGHIGNGASQGMPFMAAISWPGGKIMRAAFSPKSDRFIDLDGNVWDIPGNKVIYPAAGACIFVDGGKRIAQLGPFNGGLRVTFRDLQTQAATAFGEIWIPQTEGSIESADSEGNLIHVSAWSFNTERTWGQRILNWLRPNQASRAVEVPLAVQWLLIDARSGRILHHGPDELLAVSSDGHYAVMGQQNASRPKVYELPLHRSLWFMVLAGGVWTMFAAVGQRWWHRGLKPLLIEPTGRKEDGPHVSPAVRMTTQRQTRRLAASRHHRSRGTILGLLKHIGRPAPPGLGHLGNGK